MMKLDLIIQLSKFSDGKKEAVMAHYKFKDGKIIFMETGATKLDS